MKKTKTENDEEPAPQNTRFTAFQLRTLQKAKMDVPTNSSSNMLALNRQFSNGGSQNMMGDYPGSFHAEEDENNDTEMQEREPFREFAATSSNSNSLMNFFTNLNEDFPVKKTNTATEKKKETKKVSTDGYSLKTSFSIFSDKPMDWVYEMQNNTLPRFGSQNGQIDSQIAQYEYFSDRKIVNKVSKNKEGRLDDDKDKLEKQDFFQAIRSVYQQFRSDASKSFYFLSNGTTCFFFHNPKENVPRFFHSDLKNAPMVMIGTQKAWFKHNMEKNGILFLRNMTSQDVIFSDLTSGEPQATQQDDTEKKISSAEISNAYSKSYDMSSNRQISILLVKKKYVSTLLNSVIIPLGEAENIRILTDYPFLNSKFHRPKIVYNGPIRSSEIEDLEEENVNVNPKLREMLNMKIFSSNPFPAKLFYKLQVDGCIHPNYLRSMIELIRTKQKVLKELCDSHVITEQFDIINNDEP